MNVAYHCSDSFAPVLGTSITSLFENNRKMDEIHVYVIEEGISESNKSKLNDLANMYGRYIHFIQMPDVNKEQNLGLKKVRADWIFNSYCRLFLDCILPAEVDRVLYLDSDVLIVGDLSDLWSLDMGEYCVAGVKDCLGKKYYELLGLNDNANYCNSGVMLQNLQLWRSKNIGDRIREYVSKNGGYVFFMEQTVYNAVFQGQILILPPRYNTYTIMQCLSYNEMIRLRKPYDYYSREEVEDAVVNHKILHLTNTFLITNRAWYDDTNHPEKETFRYYKSLSPWCDEPAFEDNRNFKKKIIQNVVDILPKGFVIVFSELIYNTVRIYNIKRLQMKYKKKSGNQG